MRILHLSTSDIHGGAARSAYRLHAGLRQLGHDSRMLVIQKISEDRSVNVFTPSMGIFDRLSRGIRRVRISRSFARYRRTRPGGYELFTDDRSALGSSVAKKLPSCEVIHLRWVAHFVGYSDFFNGLPGQVPVIWTLDDMNPLTGGCHFDDACGKFVAGCGACPQLGSTDRRDLSYYIWQRKQRLFRSIDPARLHIVATNRWMERLVRQSPLLGRFPVSVIPYGLDTDTFMPRPKREARLMLGLPNDAFVILFVAQVVDLRRKGLSFLAEALREPIGDNVLLLSLGSGMPELDVAVKTLHLDQVDNDQVLSWVYSAADIFVCPSLQDNLPNTVMEAMACGTPVVAFDCGGISDMVRPGITGLLASTGDTQALRAGMAQLYREHSKRAKMGKHSRHIALQEYSIELQARRYVKLYESALRQLAPQYLPAVETDSNSALP